MIEAATSENAAAPSNNDKLLFWGCFIALITTAFGFIIRTMILDDWADQFNLSETQKGEIQGVGFWPFAVSIVLFSLIIDKIGYRNAMIFGFVCHVASAIITVTATSYTGLYVGTLIVALGNGTVEAFINPVVATMFSKDKTKWLNILHAGWPGGMVLGGILTIGMTSMFGNVQWEYKVLLILLPTFLYGLMLFRRTFPVNERVESGVEYKEMLQEIGIIGSLVVIALIVAQIGNFFQWHWGISVGIGLVMVTCYGAYVKTLGRPMFVFLMIVMIPLATTELGTDSWITSLLEPEMNAMNLHPGWVLVYTSMIMMILRFFAGPIVHRISPLGLLAVSSLLAAIGLVYLSMASNVGILIAATIYGFGKTFFWPTMLGVVSERFPKGGALTLNAIGGMGMLSVGVIGSPFLGYIQDQRVVNRLAEESPDLYKKVIGEEKTSVLGKYTPLDKTKKDAIANVVALHERFKKIQDDDPETTIPQLEEDKVYNHLVTASYDTNIRGKDDKSDKTYKEMYAALDEAKLIFKSDEAFEKVKKEKETLDTVTNQEKKGALLTVAMFPVIMLVCYIGLILYFRSIGGYKPVTLLTEQEQIDIISGGGKGSEE